MPIPFFLEGKTNDSISDIKKYEQDFFNNSKLFKFVDIFINYTLYIFVIYFLFVMYYAPRQ